MFGLYMLRPANYFPVWIQDCIIFIRKGDLVKMTGLLLKTNPVLHVDDGGKDRGSVLFVHSLAGNCSHWFSQLEHLRRSRRAIALDLRGHGLSCMASDGDYSISALADDIESAAEALDLQKFFLVGHSLGASAAIEFAGRHPEMLAGLLLADPSGDARKLPAEVTGPFLDAMQSDAYVTTVEDYWRSMIAGSNSAVQEKLLSDMRCTRREVITEAFRSTLQFDPLAPLKRYSGRKLSVIADLNDTPISLHNLLPDLPYVRISGTGHWLQLDRPEEFNRILDEFLG